MIRIVKRKDVKRKDREDKVFVLTAVRRNNAIIYNLLRFATLRFMSLLDKTCVGRANFPVESIH